MLNGFISNSKQINFYFQLSVKELERTGFGGDAFSPSFFIALTDFSVSLLFSGEMDSDFGSVFALTASSSVSYKLRKEINE